MKAVPSRQLLWYYRCREAACLYSFFGGESDAPTQDFWVGVARPPEGCVERGSCVPRAFLRAYIVPRIS